jgi:hypothetical protein
MTLIAILAGVCLVTAVWIVADMLRFRRAQKRAQAPDALGVDAGGTLYLESDRTYYRMPNGSVRKIADYRMDLRPGSPDMNMFTTVLDEAAAVHAKEVAAMKAAAVVNAKAVARGEVSL